MIEFDFFWLNMKPFYTCNLYFAWDISFEYNNRLLCCERAWHDITFFTILRWGDSMMTSFFIWGHHWHDKRCCECVRLNGNEMILHVFRAVRLRILYWLITLCGHCRNCFDCAENCVPMQCVCVFLFAMNYCDCNESAHVFF